MPSLERIRTLCEGIGQELQEGPIDDFRIANAATTLLLAAGSLERRLADFQLPAPVMERVQADLREARTTLRQIDRTDLAAAAAAADEQRGAMLEARGLILDATSVLLGPRIPG
jgi:hypothetical protein